MSEQEKSKQSTLQVEKDRFVDKVVKSAKKYKILISIVMIGVLAAAAEARDSKPKPYEQNFNKPVSGLPSGFEVEDGELVVEAGNSTANRYNGEYWMVTSKENAQFPNTSVDFTTNLNGDQLIVKFVGEENTAYVSFSPDGYIDVLSGENGSSSVNFSGSPFEANLSRKFKVKLFFSDGQVTVKVNGTNLGSAYLPEMGDGPKEVGFAARAVGGSEPSVDDLTIAAK